MGNPYFNHGNTGNSNEYELYNNTSDEIVEIFGTDFYYLLRNLQKSDWILGEDVLSHFTETFDVTLYIENAEEFDGDGQLFNKFGFSLSQDMTLSIQQNRLDELIGRAPLESDLVYHLPSKKIFEIKKIDKENNFYQMGGGGLHDSGRMMYVFTVKLFQPSYETFETEIEDIDDIGSKTDINDSSEKDAFDDEQEIKLNFDESDIFGAL